MRQLYEYLAGARGHWELVGTPSKVADELESWFDGEGADGIERLLGHS